ncbi:hypothetical protein [Pandoraea anhela]|uniref:hypothetical protein n=1 Tax=Pandoraea anhela TaxID=2508295 RepID=UPI001582597F|nr:hypothetical protein [Pandoraea anhela]
MAHPARRSDAWMRTRGRVEKGEGKKEKGKRKREKGKGEKPVDFPGYVDEFSNK